MGAAFTVPPTATPTTGYLVTRGSYADQAPLAAFVDQADAQAFANAWNLDNVAQISSTDDAATVDPIDSYPADAYGTRPAGNLPDVGPDAVRRLYADLLAADNDGASSNDVAQLVDDWLTGNGFPSVLYR